LALGVTVGVSIGLVAAGLGLFGLAAARAQALTTDLSSHLVAITTGFTGTEVVLFGATDGPGDVAVVVTGPQSRVAVRRKDRVAGIWMNGLSAVFASVPSYYALASSRPLATLAPPAVLARHQIGLDTLPLPVVGSALPPEQVAVFRNALIRDKQHSGLYGSREGQVTFLGPRLFRTTLSFPANVATGAYTVAVYLVRDREVVSAETTPLIVGKAGLSAEISDFAKHQSALYGLAAIAGALAIGWAAGAMFGRV
jgi:uncharacterized protein (TIGR02186 family)